MKRYLGIILSVLLIGVMFAAQAQEGEQVTQPTIDAAVATLIAQTQQPFAVTQTIQAALEQALTATAQPPIPEPTATPESFDVENLTLGGTTELDLMAGPAATGAYLAPDGERFVHLNRDSLCVYEGDQEQTCVDLSPIRSLDSESLRWSPDSRYIVLTENFYIMFIDPDIWLIDTSDGTLTDLTDDGPNEIEISGNNWSNIDLMPSWTDDGQLIFARYSRVSGTIMPPEIRQIAVDGSGETLLGMIDTNDDPFAIYTMDVWRDKLVYLYFAQDDTPNNGIWISDLNGENKRQIIHAERETPISAVEMSPDGRYILYKLEAANVTSEYTPETSWMQVVDVETGKNILIDSEQFVAGAGWSPEGSALVYNTYDPLDRTGAVFVTDMPGKDGTRLLDGRYNIGTPRIRQFLTWGTNNVILLSKSPEQGVVLMQLEQ